MFDKIELIRLEVLDQIKNGDLRYLTQLIKDACKYNDMCNLEGEDYELFVKLKKKALEL